MKKKVIMIGVVLIVCLGTVFYNMQKRNPYKSYNHLKTSEVLKVKEFNQYWVYFYSMDGQLKTLIDRTVPRYTEIRNKDFYYIMTAADTNKDMLKRTVEAIRGFTEDCLSGAKEKGIIYGTGAWGKGEIKNTPQFLEAYEMGKNI